MPTSTFLVSDCVHVPTITIRAFCEALYCSYAAWEAFSVGAGGEIKFTAFTQDSEGLRFFCVEFIGVRDFRWRREGGAESVEVPSREEPDDRLELSDIEVEREGDGWRFWCDPWYSWIVEFRCGGIRLNGADVTGTGRWLQDGPPAMSPEFPPFPGPSPSSTAVVLHLPGAA